MLKWCELFFNWIALGWTPLILGVYLVIKEDYTIAVVCFLVSCVGFRQILDSIRHQELRKEISDILTLEERNRND
jgi:hypothetical protein